MEIPKNWEIEQNHLIRIFEFKNFVESVKFVNDIVPIAEKYNHHPDIDIYGYRFVKIKLSTHDKGNVVTEKDIEIAQNINLNFD